MIYLINNELVVTPGYDRALLDGYYNEGDLKLYPGGNVDVFRCGHWTDASSEKAAFLKTLALINNL